jgi:hypothetical protein
MLDYISYIILIISISLLILLVSLIVYYGTNTFLITALIIVILLGIIGCGIYISEHTPILLNIINEP